MFGKIMSLQDNLIIKYFILLTRIDLKTIKEYENSITNPRDLKMKLAFEITKMYHSKKDAELAQDYFIKTFSKKEIPSEVEKFKPSKYDIVSILIESGLVPSKSEARRTIIQGGVKVDGIVVKDVSCSVARNSIIQKGKIKFIKIV
jgi:tyrosyl-tRNA synthetase